MTAPTVIPARPTLYRGITMRSRLEAGYAAWLDARGVDWEYEPMVFAGPDGQYLPDFRLANIYNVFTAEKGPVYVEVKPTWNADLADRYAQLMAPLCDLGTVVLQSQSFAPGELRWLWPGEGNHRWLGGHWTPGPSLQPCLAATYNPTYTPWAGEWWAGIK